uniref:Uncharacterized protein n=1 Tax=Hemiselmis andersenii TaxID=464988 RepID=A0A6T8IXP0_HEMAN|mmetsp:Transcript_14425/g.33349  ORF Transcript_14425/g.33349 Transcript_14425/m.33349 type:complete len:275 (+) Transcript_14425:166-990(+)
MTPEEWSKWHQELEAERQHPLEYHGNSPDISEQDILDDFLDLVQQERWDHPRLPGALVSTTTTLAPHQAAGQFVDAIGGNKGMPGIQSVDNEQMTLVHGTLESGGRTKSNPTSAREGKRAWRLKAKMPQPRPVVGVQGELQELIKAIQFPPPRCKKLTGKKKIVSDFVCRELADGNIEFDETSEGWVLRVVKGCRFAERYLEDVFGRKVLDVQDAKLGTESVEAKGQWRSMTTDVLKKIGLEPENREGDSRITSKWREALLGDRCFVLTRHAAV